jgi:hypothetical protein
VHQLKSWPEFFEPVLAGVKTFELRAADRDYKVGDILHLKEWSNQTQQFTGRELKRRVTYVMHGQAGIVPLIGLHRHYCVMALVEAS